MGCSYNNMVLCFLQVFWCIKSIQIHPLYLHCKNNCFVTIWLKSPYSQHAGVFRRMGDGEGKRRQGWCWLPPLIWGGLSLPIVPGLNTTCCCVTVGTYKQKSCLLAVSFSQCALLLPAGPGFLVPWLAAEHPLAWNTLQVGTLPLNQMEGGERDEKGGLWLVLSFWNLYSQSPGRQWGWR